MAVHLSQGRELQQSNTKQSQAVRGQFAYIPPESLSTEHHGLEEDEYNALLTQNDPPM